MFTFTVVYPEEGLNKEPIPVKAVAAATEEDEDEYDPMDTKEPDQPQKLVVSKLNSSQSNDSVKDHGKTQAKLFTFDSGVIVLADPGWDGKSDLSYLEPYIESIELIILSQTTTEYIGAYAMLLHRYPSLRKLKTYATLPVSKIGRISVVELYRSVGIIGPVEGSIMEVEEVENYFNRITTLNYSQSIALQGNLNGLKITAYNSGHTLGGSYWLLTKEGERTVYIPTWNHASDSFLRPAKLVTSNLMRPTTLITGSDLGSTMSYKRRIDTLLELINLSIKNNTSVILPTSIGGRLLELLPTLDLNISPAVPFRLVSYNGDDSLRFSSNMLEWMSPNVTKSWETQNHSPFESNRLKVCSIEELSEINGPKVIFCTGIDIEEGSLSREVIADLCVRETCTVILTERPAFQSTAYELFKTWETQSKENGSFEDGSILLFDKTIQLSVIKEEFLHGHELSAYITQTESRIKKQQETELMLLQKENEDEELLADDQDDDQEGDDVFSGDEGGNTTNNKNGNHFTNGKNANSLLQVPKEEEETMSIADVLKLQMDFDVRGAKGSNRLFPYIQKATEVDDYGIVIKHADFMREEEKFPLRKQIGAGGKINEGDGEDDDEGDEDGDEDGEDGEGADDEYFAGGKRRRRNGHRSKNRTRKIRKTDFNTGNGIANNNNNNNNPLLELGSFENPRSRERTFVNLEIKCGLTYIDLGGLADLRSLRLTINALKPRRVIVLPEISIGFGGGATNVLQTLNSRKDENPNMMMLAETHKSIQTEYLLAKGNSMMNLGDIITSYEVQLSDELAASLHWQHISGGYSVAYIAGEIGSIEEEKEGKEEDTSTNDELVKSSNALVKTDKNSKLFMLKPLQVSNNLSTNDRLAIGDIKLTELRKRLVQSNHKAEFKGFGTLVVDDYISVRKITDGNLVIDGNVSRLFYEVREIIQDMVAII